jgi:Cu(I)/Ag(I) efflux system membrane fusion protein
VFEPREIELGPKGEGFFVVLDGLAEGEVVVSRGNFQIDAELQIRGQRSMMSPAGRASTDTLERPKVTGEAGEALARLWRSYDALSDALASDDAAEAREAAGKFGNVISSVDVAVLPIRTAQLWRDQRERIGKAAGRAERADDIAAMREAFQPISLGMLAVLSSVRVEGVGPLYEAHCPMAFDFAGASWVSPDRAIRNPYFGDEMYRCGTIRETVMPAVVPESDDHGDGKPASHDSEDHADHSHG